ncbi:MAG: LytTR family DNA-binding domain-containing protein [Verrucomicrobia bacterium]|nr:LytTR family DNA-binding domain-containing protein [Verrucomicrobiota bacterium]
MNSRVLLIDDEADARAELRWLLSAYPAYTIVGEAATFAAARRLLRAGGYDLVFLDIQLFGGTGFDLVPDIAPPARIIFVTAYDRHALRAFEVNALDYLLKPVSPDRFAAALARVAGPGSPPPPSTPFRADDTILVHTDVGDRFLPLAHIAAVFSNENYSAVHLRTHERFLTRRTLKSWEDNLPATHFRRVHRQALVNLAHIASHRRDTRETAELRVTGVPDPVPVSRAYLPDLRPLLEARPPSPPS